MCGIAGLISRNSVPSAKVLNNVQQALSHRGPDDNGLHLDGRVALAHTRLSIIDLSGGHQPLFSEDKSLCLIANGEIYNHQEIRSQFENHGYRFKTQSDCEVILALYEQHGRDCVKYLRGMFAFALWDSRSRKLLLGRDRMGEKPLYFSLNDQRLLFSSEVRALLSSGLVNKELSPKAIARYFRYQYVPEPETPFLDISKLPAGTTLQLDLDTWKWSEAKYWSPWDARPLEGNPKNIIREALEDAVKTSLISDVPIGLSLSGGIDSSILACLMRANSNKDIHAISIGYPDAQQVDERSQAKALAERLDLCFHDVELCDSEMVKLFPSIAVWRDDPIGDISGFNYYAIMRHARDTGVKVMLQGHGADEICWGYPWVKDAVGINEKGIAGLASPMRGSSSWLEKIQVIIRHIRALKSADTRGTTMYELQPFTHWVIHNASMFFSREFQAACEWENISSLSEYGVPELRMDLEINRLIIDYYLLGNGIAQGDRLSMANSVEVRLPFVDHKFVETIVGLRKTQRDDHLPTKYWLKESVRDLLGDEIINRPKRGFAPPMMRWQKELRKAYGHLLREGYLVSNNILSHAAAERLTRQDIALGPEATVSRLAINLELWARGVILEENAAELPF